MYSRKLLSAIVMAFANITVAGGLNINSQEHNASDTLCMNKNIFLKASEVFKSAEKSMENGAFDQASTLLDSGISDIGNDYATPATVDDTPMKLTLARVVQKQGNIQQAASLKRSVLLSRLEMYKKKFKCE